ncbi:MAG TPA: DUF6379 domain-containing protein [Naasia sp.]
MTEQPPPPPRSPLRADALSSTGSGFELRVGLPWIRSMPLSAVLELGVGIDGVPLDPAELTVSLDGTHVPPGDLTGHDAWWFLQDRLVLAGARPLAPGSHAVTVDLRLMVPYLQAGPDAPLVLPLHLAANLLLDASEAPSVARDVA